MFQMHRQIFSIAAISLLLASSATSQEHDAMMRWGDATVERLAGFLPNATPWSFTPEAANAAPDFKGFANGAAHRYIALTTNKTWYFDDVQLSRQLDEVQKENASLKQEMDRALSEFMRVHGAEMEKLKKEHLATMEAASHAQATEITALSKQAQELFQQGKSQEAQAVLSRISAIAQNDNDKLEPFHYEPFEQLTSSFDKRQDALTERERELLAGRRQVEFTIFTNRTASNAAFGVPVKPIGVVAGRTLYVQDRGVSKMGGGHVHALLNLIVYLGPANLQNPHVQLGQSELKVKSIVVAGWIESRTDTIEADEATVKKVLATIDYNKLSELIEP